MNQSIISWWRDSQGGTRGVTALILTTFLWAQVYPAAAVAKDALESKDSQASFIKTNVVSPKNASTDDPQRATMEGLAKTLSGMNVALKKHRDVLIKRKDKKGNLHITILGTKADVDLTSARKEINQFKQQLAAQDLETEASFKRDAEHIKAHNLSAVIQQRHDEAVTKYEKNRDEFQKELGALEQSQDLNTLLIQSDALLKAVNSNLPKHAKFDPKNLPFRTVDPKVREPATTPQALRKILASNQSQLKLPTLDVAQRKQDVSDTEIAAIEKASKEGDSYVIPPDPVRVASIGSMSGLLMASVAPPPGPEYLAPTEDVQITSAIQAKAAELHNNPVEIYNWVHNNVEWIPSYGSIQGSQLTLDKLQGNAFDTSSLLIALLRAANVPARYVYGTVEIPVDKLQNWVGGTTNPDAAQQLLGQGGIPNAGLTKGGQTVAIRMEHVWVEAFVDAYPSRGAKNIVSEAWMPMDPSFKQYAYPPDIAALGTNPTADQLGAAKTVIAIDPPTLAAALPYHVGARGLGYALLPTALRHQFRYSLYIDNNARANDSSVFDFQSSTPRIAGKKVVFGFAPSSDADRQAIESYLPKPHSDGSSVQASEYSSSLPAYGIYVTPQIRVDDQVVASGGSFTLGTELLGEGGFTQLNDLSVWDLTTDPLTAGQTGAIGISLEGIDHGNLENLRRNMVDARTRISNNQIDQISRSDIADDPLVLAAWTFFTTVQDYGKNVQRFAGMVDFPALSYGLVHALVVGVRQYGVVTHVQFPGILMDIGHGRRQAFSKSNDISGWISYNRLRGRQASESEYAIPETIFALDQHADDGMSAVKAIAVAQDQGQAIYVLTQDHQNDLQYVHQSPTIMQDVQDALSSGKEVTIHAAPISFSGFHGAGYIIIDPATGAGSYLIEGGAHGGELVGAAASMGVAALVPCNGGGDAACGPMYQVYLSTNPNPDRTHYYEHQDFICDTSSPCCTLDNVMPFLKEHRVNGASAGTLGNAEVISVIDPFMGIPIGYVTSTTNEAEYSITNITLPGHLFYPGAVVRGLLIENSKLVVRTIGTGNGPLPAINAFVGPLVFEKADQKIKQDYDSFCGAH